MPKRYWLFKSESTAYSYDDLVRDKVAEWDGVRNFQARNYLRDEVKAGDEVIFYYSNVSPMAAVGTAVVVRAGYPDHTAWDPMSQHPDPKSTRDKPIWYMVDIKPDKKFRRPVTLDEIKTAPELKDMVLLNNSRLSVQPVAPKEWELIMRMGGIAKKQG